jgi:hypothetical protein
MDVLLKLLVTKIFPSIFEQRRAELNDTSIWESQMGSIPGGEALLKQRLTTRSGPVTPTIAYLCPNESWDEAAAHLLSNKQIDIPSLDDLGLAFKCHSSLALDFEKDPVSYKIRLELDQSASCECQDFLQRGGACKHIRAALLRLNDLRSRGLNLPYIQLPSSIEDAQILQARRFSNMLTDGQTRSGIASPLRTPMECAAAAVEDELRESDDAYLVDPENPQPTHTEHLRAEEDSESDNESIATDAPDDGERNAFDFTALRGTSKAAFDEQTITRVFYELEGAAPKLGEIGAYLKHCSSLKQPQDFERAFAFQRDLGLLYGELNRLVTNYINTQNPVPGPGPSQHSALTVSHPPPSTPPATLPAQAPGHQERSCKRTVLDIIGASPEKASKRKQSYKPF